MHRELEEAYFLTERMVTHAHLAGLMKYPGGVLQEALEATLFCEFHDILPGSGIPEVEALALQRMGHGLEILSRLRNKAFFNLLAGQIPATKGEFPILVYNPEPFSIEETIVVELQAPEPNFNPEVFLLPELFDQNGQPVEYQLEKESANIANDHRKRLVFKAQLRPSDMNRFSCRLREADILEKPGPPAQQDLRFTNDRCEVWINDETGLVDRYRADGIDCLKPDSFELLVMNDNADPWGMKVTSFRDLAGRFHLVKPSETAGITGTGGPIKPVRIIEDGPVRTVVEAIFRYNRSDAVVTYCIPKKGAEIEIGVRLYWNERDRFLKLAVPTTFKNHQGLGQVAYGVQKFPHDGEEHVAHQWLGLFPEDSGTALTISNSVTYGFDLSDGEIRLSLLRSPAYAGHPVDDITPIVRQDRFTERMDQGAHSFRFRINAGPVEERTRLIDLESRLLNCGSVALCCYPVKKGRHPGGGLILSDKRIRLATMKMDPENQKIIVRLFENSGNPITAGLEWPGLIPETRLVFKPFEIKTLIIDPVEHVIKESDRLI
jgi:alpha-mannosidase